MRRASVQSPPPDTIPNYVLLNRLGDGAFGEVWRAREELTQVERAIKILRKSKARQVESDLAGVVCYQNASHNHPHLLQVLAVGQTERVVYYVMELGDCASSDARDDAQPITLRVVLRKGGRPSPRESLELVSKLAAGVAHLHAQGLRHNDVKPENVIFVHGEPKLGDFGLTHSAEEPRPGVGTPPYMPKEGVANDVFALGKVLYELISGRPASEFPRPPKELPPDPPAETRAAIQVANRACDPKPERRFESIEALRAALHQALKTDRSLVDRWRRLPRRARVGVGIGLVALLPVVAWMGVTLARSIWPLAVFQEAIPLSRPEFVLSEINARDPNERSFVRLEGEGPEEGLRLRAYELARSVRYFCVDAEFDVERPWGNARLELAATRDGPALAVAWLVGQPNGLGLRAVITALRPKNQGELRAELRGHPMAGVSYALRVLRSRGQLVLCLWPLVGAAREPLVAQIDDPDPAAPLRWIRIRDSTIYPHSALVLDNVTVRGYQRVFAPQIVPPPACVASAPRPPHVQPVVDAHPLAHENLLRGRLHPIRSALWTPIGHWSWWALDEHEDDGEPWVVSTPCSSGEREDTIRQPLRDVVYESQETLRFDGAEYDDLEAHLRLRLTDQSGPHASEYAPIPIESHGGRVALLVRTQAVATDGPGWGGGYAVALGAESADVLRRPDVVVSLTIERFRGLALERCGHAGDAVRAQEVEPLAHQVLSIPHGEFYAPDGIELCVRADGPVIAAWLASRPDDVVRAVDDRPDAPRRGRVALQTQGMIARFTSLDVQRLHADGADPPAP